MTIQDYRPEFAYKIADLFTAAVHAVDGDDYTPAQRFAWAPQPPAYPHWAARLARKLPFVAVADGEPAGFIELEKDGHIDCFYVHPRHQGSGVGDALFRYAETVMLSRKMPRLYADVSLSASRFFLKRGFETIAENKIARGGEVLVNHTMQRLRSGLEIYPCERREAMPFDLFLMADPSREQIDAYLDRALVFLLREGGTVLCGYILTRYSETAFEVKNIAVREDYQGKGYGKLLLSHAAAETARRGYGELVIGTGNSSLGQLGLYQKMGFAIFETRKDFFVLNYPEPIWENGIQCRDMIMLRKSV